MSTISCLFTLVLIASKIFHVAILYDEVNYLRLGHVFQWKKLNVDDEGGGGGGGGGGKC